MHCDKPTFLVEVTAVPLQQCCRQQNMQPVSLCLLWNCSSACCASEQHLNLSRQREKLSTETHLWVNLGHGQACGLGWGRSHEGMDLREWINPGSEAFLPMELLEPASLREEMLCREAV